MKIKLSLFIAILLVLSLVLSCSSTKTSEPEVVEVVEETIQEEPIKAELIDNYLYINNHRVDVYLNGGTLVGDAEEILEKANADRYVTMPEVKKDGYKFLGWYNLDTDSYDNRRNISLSEFNRDTKFQASFDLDMSLLDISDNIFSPACPNGLCPISCPVAIALVSSVFNPKYFAIV